MVEKGQAADIHYADMLDQNMDQHNEEKSEEKTTLTTTTPMTDCPGLHDAVAELAAAAVVERNRRIVRRRYLRDLNKIRMSFRDFSLIIKGRGVRR